MKRESLCVLFVLVFVSVGSAFAEAWSAKSSKWSTLAARSYYPEGGVATLEGSYHEKVFLSYISARLDYERRLVRWRAKLERDRLKALARARTKEEKLRKRREKQAKKKRAKSRKHASSWTKEEGDSPKKSSSKVSYSLAKHISRALLGRD